MDLTLSEEQQMLQRSARDFLERACPTTKVRALREPSSSGHDPELFQQMGELGWLGLPFSEQYGGGGATLFELGLIYEEAGRALVPTSLYSTVEAALLLDALGSEAQKEGWLPAMVAGQRVSTLAASEPQAIHDPRFWKTQAQKQGSHWILHGRKVFVRNAHLAEPLFVVARTGSGAVPSSLTVFAVSPQAEGCLLESQETFGKDRQSLVSLDGVEVEEDEIVGGKAAIGRSWEALVHLNEQTTALQCLEMVGGAQRVLEMTVDHVRTREQFGRPIGSFQAVQHHVANMAIAVDGARLASYQALWRVANDLSATREVAIAKAWSGEAYKQVTVMAHQLFGGMGYVKETDLHLWSERAKAAELFLGARDNQLQRLAKAMGL
ncbi:MAG: acyl-CoA/acyl-ACP dehydrogenase [Firmicutes bacterium]|nr:acyl-CoA/acyl-ACP dehydrogenase [Bacillota bacterium]